MSSNTLLQPQHPIVHHLPSAPAVPHPHTTANKITDKENSEISTSSTMADDSLRTTTSSSSSSNNDSQKFKQRQIDDLFAALKSKQSDKYRFIEFNSNPKNTSQYKKQVSFDDIDLHFDDDAIPEPDDDFGWEVYKMKNRGRMGRGSLPGYGREEFMPPSLGSRLSPSPVRNTLDLDSRLDLIQMENNLVQYPTTPITNKRGCTLRKRHKRFEELDANRSTLRPMFRTILVYISARIHTWVALDWILANFIENGDHVIIVAAIDPRLVEGSTQRRGRTGISPSISPQRNALSPGRMSALSQQRSKVENDPLSRLLQNSKPENIVNIGDRIMNYVMEVINPERIAKITVELVEGRTKEVLQDMYRLYEPNLVCTGSKPNSKVGAPLRSWQSSKLTDRLVKNFPLPVIAVPAMNMLEFEEKLQNRINHGEELPKHKAQHSNHNNQINESDEEDEDEDEDEEDDEDDDEVRSINSVTSDSSYDSYFEVGQQYYDYKRNIHKGLEELDGAPLTQDYYSNIVQFISDQSLKFCSEIIDIQPSFAGHGANLARAITGSNSFGKAGYKSMLDTNERSPPPSQNKISFKEVKEQLRLNKIKTELETFSSSSSTIPPPPSIDIVAPTPSASPTPSPTREPSLLKFVNLEKPSTNSDREKKKQRSPLRKCLSHSDQGLSVPTLEPRKSHPGLLEHSRDESSKKKKKKKFWLF